MDIRGIILEALLLYEKGDDFADRIIKNTLNKYSYLHKYERSFINRVYTGTIERELTLDYIINAFSTVKTRKQKPVIRNILRMSVYQLVFMDSVPESAAINEAVKLAKKKKFTSLSGFVNGVLRSVLSNKDNIKYPDDNDVTCLSVKYSCPEWIVKHFIDEVGLHNTEAILDNSLKARPLIIRTNLYKNSRDELKERLESEGVTAEKCDVDGLYTDAALVIKDYDTLNDLSSFTDGCFTVQDLSSQQVAGGIVKDKLCSDYGRDCEGGVMSTAAPFLNTSLPKAATILDVCASPGGKTCHIADFLKKEGIDAAVISRDISEDKIKKINENIMRCGFGNVKTEVHDALVLDESLIGKADIVIADLPCSGLGVIGRKVDIKYRVQPDDLKTLSALQRDILVVVSQYVKPGGMLIYSTCTLNRMENEDNAAWIENSLGFRLCKPYTKILNDNEFTDGFFISRFIKDIKDNGKPE